MSEQFYILTEVEIKTVTIHFGGPLCRMDITAQLNPLGVGASPGRKNEVYINIPMDVSVLDVIKDILQKELGKVFKAPD